MKKLAGSRQKAEGSFLRATVGSPPPIELQTLNFKLQTPNFGLRTSNLGLSVVGAGPGDPELITLKGLKALQSADVVMYDALVDEALLDYAPPAAARIFVGKRKGKPSFKQQEINELIVDFARLFGHVVRLKGGDPFVFGRGLEEMQYASSQGLRVQYIPGISSAVAGPGAIGIPVTLRGASRGFWVLTATTDTGELNPEIVTAASTDSTVIVLMGLSQLPKIASIYAKAGKSAYPVAVISNATLSNEKSVTGTMADIQKRVEAAEISSPAIIVAGEVVSHQMQTVVHRKKLANV
ncbi:MAG: uroporphyrinogen-III C-methyltransferase [Saprospiraceae bacterium]|nr:uroporphyrinogen-III C-methyltransferase [Saprospiraceae bacterium]